ncbi:MAG: 3-deoxy-D-manno-octulosonic acid transferase [Alphaproteobacteria bacterium]|nr:3-deoxy-D-manno-octulosonic acid transferase [Alphaproteobacteria bacterium]
MTLPKAYRVLTGALAPLLILYLQSRRQRGKEDQLRFRERLGEPSRERPKGPLVWIHAASVGEAVSVLPLIERLRRERPRLECLLTTGTVASARLIEPRLPEGVRHQFVPVDLPRSISRFLDHWRPQLAIWVESELWPNLVLASAARGLSMILLNARLSARSYARWRILPGLIRPMLAGFSLCLAQDEEQAERFRHLGAVAAASLGDLKSAASPLPADPAAVSMLRARLAGRPLWLAASTHPGEEEIAAEAHRLLAIKHPNIITIIAPRHPGRGAALADMLAARGFRTARRAQGELPEPDTDIYIGDTMGELGLLYRLAGIALIGGSMVGKGGHNPFEAARLDCAVLHGPDMSNCAGMAAALAAAGASETVTDPQTLARALSRLLSDPQERAARAAAGARAAAHGFETLGRVLDRLAPWLDRLVPPEDAAPLPRRAGASA